MSRSMLYPKFLLYSLLILMFLIPCHAINFILILGIKINE